MPKNIFVTYWSQVLIILTVVAYFIKRVFDSSDKKIQISYTIFQQNKLKALEDFISLYENIYIVINDIQLKPSINNKISYREFDDKYFFENHCKILPLVRKLNIYCSESEMTLIEKIVSNNIKMQTVYKKVFDNSLDDAQKMKLALEIKESNFKILDENEIILDHVFKNIKTVYRIGFKENYLTFRERLSMFFSSRNKTH